MSSASVIGRAKALRVGAALLGATMIALLAPAGCTSGSKVAGGRAYPTHKPQTRVLDIQVIRRDTRITATNVTSEAIGPCTMWVNAEFSREFDGLAIGESKTLSLLDFHNEFGESFRGGGFFATQRPSDLVQAQLEGETEMTGLIVVNGRAQR